MVKLDDGAPTAELRRDSASISARIVTNATASGDPCRSNLLRAEELHSIGLSVRVGFGVEPCGTSLTTSAGAHSEPNIRYCKHYHPSGRNCMLCTKGIVFGRLLMPHARPTPRTCACHAHAHHLQYNASCQPRTGTCHTPRTPLSHQRRTIMRTVHALPTADPIHAALHTSACRAQGIICERTRPSNHRPARGLSRVRGPITPTENPHANTPRRSDTQPQPRRTL
jgi:hypothetical protein